MTTPASDTTRKLDDLFAAERAVRRAHDDLVEMGRDALLPALEAAVASARDLDDEDERALRLVRVARLLGELEGPRVVDLLIDVLGAEDPEPRRDAGEALADLAFERFKEVALGVERALGRLPVGSPALHELPYLLAEVPEPGVTKLVGMFLKHKDAEAVACAIEALVELGDPTGAPLLAPLEKDARVVQLEDEEGEEGRATLGELALEARELLAMHDPDAVVTKAERPRGRGR